MPINHPSQWNWRVYCIRSSLMNMICAELGLFWFQETFWMYLVADRGCGWTPHCPTLLRFGSKNCGVTRHPKSPKCIFPLISRLFLFFLGRIPTHVPISKLNSAAVAGIPVYAMDSVTDHRLVFVQWWWTQVWQRLLAKESVRSGGDIFYISILMQLSTVEAHELGLI